MKQILSVFVSVLLLSSCKTLSSTSGKTDNGVIDLTLVQINDVYEIAPLSEGKEGGIARVATLKKKWQQKNPNTLLVMAGDFLSPSVYNSLRHEGKAVRGKQMIDALNAAGLDIAVFGNHEFDLRESELQERLNESSALWVATNTFQKSGGKTGPFEQRGKPLPVTHILRIRDRDGTTAKMGIIGITLPANRAEYVQYNDALQSAKDAYNGLKDSVDAVIAITHQFMASDTLLARELPGLAAVVGGHEHDGRYAKIGAVPVTKALANARNAYLVNVQINKKRGTRKVKTWTEALNEKVSLDPATDAVVRKWTAIADSNYASSGFDAKAIIINKGEALDGRETETRSRPTNLTKLIVDAMKDAAPQADVVLLNGGSIRVDDVMQLPVSQYDLLRALPFGGGITEADIKGALLLRVLEAGRKNIGGGGFLQTGENLVWAADKWTLNGGPINPSATYRVAVPDFLLTGKEANMDFFNPTNVDVVKVYPAAAAPDPQSDIRLAIVKYAEKNASLYR